jgi:hypothetical protein
MEIKLIRSTIFQNCIIGALYIEDTFLCFTLEDLERKFKIKHKTAIPRGRYRIILSWSNRFKKLLPEVLDVPDFSGIRFHTGNTSADTSGCILVGMEFDDNYLKHSKDAMKYLMSRLNKVYKKEKIFLTITI